MKIRILGTRGEIESSAPWHSRRSGILVDGSILLDIGEEEYLDAEPDAAVITHLHPDHAFFARDGVDFEGEIDFPVYAPGEYEGDVVVRKLPDRLKIGKYEIRAIPARHSLKVESRALVIDDGKSRICYTGDMIWIDKKHDGLLEDLDLVITEGSFYRRKGMVRRDRDTGRIYGHNGIPDLVRLFSRFTSHIRLVHFGSWFYRDISSARGKIRDLGHEYGVDVRATRDGEEIALEDLE